MAAQAKEQYYSQTGGLAVAANPAIRQAWDTAVQAAKDGLSAGLTPQSAAWDRGVTRGSFATVMCPAWLLHQIATLGGPLGSGGWNVTTAPGGAGNSGGFYLALPKAGGHQQAAFQLATFLAGEQAGVELFRTQGEFPANFAAATAVNGITNPYFSGAQVGRIFGRSADRTPGRRARPGQRRDRHRHGQRTGPGRIRNGATGPRLAGRGPAGRGRRPGRPAMSEKFSHRW